jgi:hypothetical protein
MIWGCIPMSAIPVATARRMSWMRQGVISSAPFPRCSTRAVFMRLSKAAFARLHPLKPPGACSEINPRPTRCAAWSVGLRTLHLGIGTRELLAPEIVARLHWSVVNGTLSGLPCEAATGLFGGKFLGGRTWGGQDFRSCGPGTDGSPPPAM